MHSFPKRYVFVGYDSLKKIQFSKLEKVCSKVFIFISNKRENIPVHLVMQAQRLGKRVKWIAVQKDKGNGFVLPITFKMGILHEKVNEDIEFAILSNDEAFDTIVNFIHQEGRNCLRVTTQGDEEEHEDFEEEEDLDVEAYRSSFSSPEPKHKFKVF